MSTLLDDPNIKIIKQCVREVVPNAKVILFGSRAKHTAKNDSDYDLLVIVNNETPHHELLSISRQIRKLLATHHIPVDAIVRTSEMAKESSKHYWTIVAEAFEHGIEL